MHYKTVLTFGLIAPFVLAKTCNDITIPVEINARQAIFNQAPITDNFVATEWALDMTSTRNGGNYTNTIVAGYQTVIGSYNIGATFCRPDTGIPSNPTVQLLIHGIGFDRSSVRLSRASTTVANIEAAIGTSQSTMAQIPTSTQQ